MAGLVERTFSYLVTKDGRIRISWRSTVVTTVAGSKATRLIAALSAADEAEVRVPVPS